MEFDKDLTARQEARELAHRAETAQRKLEKCLSKKHITHRRIES